MHARDHSAARVPWLPALLGAMLLVGNTGLDLVVPGNNFLERQVQAGVYQKLDRSLLPILRHLDPALLEQVARITEHTGFANANIAGTALLPAELREDPMVYPDAATMHRLQVATVHTGEYSRLQNREFMRFRTGQ